MSDQDQDEAQKTEEPTEKKLREAHQKGQVAKSREVNHWFMLLSAGIVIFAAGPGLMRGFHDLLRGFLSHPHLMPSGTAGLGAILFSVLIASLGLIALPLAGFLVAAVLGNVIQHGFLLSAENMKPKLSKISPLAGLKRLFSLKSIVEFLKGVFKLIIVAGVAAVLIVPAIGTPSRLVDLSAAALLLELKTLVLVLLAGVVAVMTVIAGLDWLYQIQDFRKKMRMTKQEVKDEFKQSEGDPHVKGKLKQIRMERAKKRMMAKVPEADVVITNPRHYAVALEYREDQMAAPRCIAKGADHMARRIREVAEENEVPVVENPPLARALFASVELDQEIPPEHYRAVAQVISYVFNVKRRTLRPGGAGAMAG